MSETTHSRGGSRLGRRLVVQLTLVTGVACALMAWASYELVRRTFEEQWAADLDQRIAATAAGVEELRHDAEESVTALSNFLRQDDPETLGRLLAGGVGAAGEANRLMSRVDLQWLEILDGQATILSSAVWPEQAGLRQDELLRLPPDRAWLMEVVTAARVLPAFVTRHELRVGSRVVHLVGGVLLDESALSRRGPGATWLRVERGDGEVYTIGAPPFDPDVGWQGLGPEARSEVGNPAVGRWLLARGEIAVAARAGEGAAGSADLEVWFLTAVSRSEGDRRLRRTRHALAGFAVLAALLAGIGGLWIARRVTAPVAELVRSVDAIAAGTEDYTFTRSTQDEFEELTTSFSRLHRSLELQRQRSRAAERVAAWRDVARRVAHEVKNPLAPIRLTVENLVRARRRPGTLFDEMFDEGAETILEEVDRLKRLVGEFSEFARLPLPKLSPTDLATLVDDAAALYSAEPGLELQVRHAPDLPLVLLDADQISRALANVMGNGIEAMRTMPPDHDRRLTIRTRAEEEMVRIEVDDRGPGLSEEALEKLFEPYFTTKQSGTGLGLSITYRIITEHGGVITANNRVEGGVQVTIRLPVASSAGNAPRAGAPETREAQS